MPLTPQPAVPATATALVNPFGQQAALTVTGGTVQGIQSGWPSPAPSVTTPAIPASTTPVTNTNPFPVLVTITGGTTTHIAVNGADQGTVTPFAAVVPAGGTIAITYSVIPTSWAWTSLFAGIAGSPVGSPFSVPVLPGGAVTLVYTVAPTWSWANLASFGYSPAYAALNTGLTNLEGNLPWPAHAEASQTGLGIAVSN